VTYNLMRSWKVRGSTVLCAGCHQGFGEKRLCQNMKSENGGIGKQGRITEVKDTIGIDDEVYDSRASPKKVTGKCGPLTGDSDGRRKRTKIGNTNARRQVIIMRRTTGTECGDCLMYFISNLRLIKYPVEAK